MFSKGGVKQLGTFSIRASKADLDALQLHKGNT